MRFTGKVAIVTGGAKGMGVGIARILAREGAQVAIGDIDAAAASTTAALLSREEQAEVISIPIDLAQASDARRLVEQTIARFGTVDILVNNAATINMHDFASFPESDYDRILAVNLKAPFLTGQAVARHLIERKKPGAIVNITTVGAELARERNAAYHASKGGLQSLTQAMAMDLAKYNIRVNAIGPGGGPSAMVTGTPPTPGGARLPTTNIPLGRMASAEEMGLVVAFLASDDASFVTGQHFYVDGGRTTALR